MGYAADALLQVRAGLCAGIDRLAAELGQAGPAQLHDAVAELRGTALAYGLEPFAALARALDRAVAGGERRAAIHAHLDLMRDAAGCDRADPQASEAWLAMLGSRLHG